MKNIKIKELENQISQIKGFTPEKYELLKELEELKKIPKREKLIKELEKETWKEYVDKNAKSIKKLINIELEKEIKQINSEICQYVYEKAHEKKINQRNFWRNGAKNNPFSSQIRNGVK